MKRIIKIIIIALFAIVSVLGLWAYINGYLSRSKASTEVATVRFSKGLTHANVGDEVLVELILSTASSTNSNPGISGVDIRFTDTGSNLDFMVVKTTATLPTGFDANVLDSATSISGTAPRHIRRLSFVSKKPAAQLQKSIVIPLYFKVMGTGSLSSSVTVDTANSLVVGPPGMTYPVVVDTSASNFAITSADVSATPGTILTPVVQPTGAFNLLTPVPTIMGVPQTEGGTTSITENSSLLYINSIASYPSPFRYEQPIQLEKGTYHLTVNAKVYVRRGRGLIVALICNEASCGTKTQNQTLYATAPFPVKSEFSQFTDTITIPDAADNKKLNLRIFCEDGSECEIDTISLEDAWGSERVVNGEFSDIQKLSDPRKQPNSWAVDSTANLYGSVDPAFGHNGSLMINNSIK